jgi:hypothetical protein
MGVKLGLGNRMLRRIFGPKRYEGMGEWCKQHNEELYNFSSLPSMFRMMKLKRMRWACSMNGENRNAYRLLWESQKGSDHKEDQDIDGG